MKKEDVTGLIVYLLIVGIALVFCFTVLREHSTYSGLDFFPYWLYIVGAVLSGVLFNGILYEVAHILGAKAGRYEIISVCILGLLFYKNAEGKTKVKFSGFDGLTGETKILPKENAKKEPNPRPYLLFGTLFYAVEIIAFVTIFTLFRSNSETAISNIAYFVLTMGVVGGVILLYNILPLKLDSVTDGYRLTMISNSKNKEAFNELLKVEYAISQGQTDVEIKTFDTITNFTADLNLNKVYVLLDQEKFEEAEKIIDIILTGEGEVSQKVYLRARAQKIYIELMTKDAEQAKEYYLKNIQLSEARELSRDISMPSIRTYILISGLMDKSHSETILCLNNVYRAYKGTSKTRRNTEIKLFNLALKKVMDENPKWTDIGDYILEEEGKKETPKKEVEEKENNEEKTEN